ncbi:hypothetical protein Poli38472_006738 [Pythium oligandrum]|uniref:Uncharacterized protein n=1 Tax=Pythium oligandrum TaxID=41045 RepID=A0A8K1FFE7_PYTOL|nr:hypothetical protein Poli38472_006738 [Pythium oligandrum]|eukprot:TMW56728.1 hypothetical protein Poli38472_006738 [Pythium oligandrum]
MSDKASPVSDEVARKSSHIAPPVDVGEEETGHTADAVKISEPPEDDERRKLMDAFLEKWLPNKKIWPQLRLGQPPQDVFDRKDLPFSQRTLCLLFGPGWREALSPSIFLPYWGSMFSVGGATFVAFSALAERAFNDNFVKYPKLGVM